MNHFEKAVEVAAKGIWEYEHNYTGGPSWEDLPFLKQHNIKELALPAVQALKDAGLLKEQA